MPRCFLLLVSSSSFASLVKAVGKTRENRFVLEVFDETTNAYILNTSPIALR